MRSEIVRKLCIGQNKIMLMRKHMSNTLLFIDGKTYASLRGWL